MAFSHLLCAAAAYRPKQRWLVILLCSAAAALAAPPSPPAPPTLVTNWTSAPCTYSGARQCGFTIDGPLVGNGDVGAMMGVSTASNVTFYLTKNDFWCLSCGVQPKCRYGTYNNTLFFPPMQLDSGCVYPASGDRNSQGLVGGATISPVDDFIATSGGAWAASQSFGNATVSGSFALGSGAGALETLSFVAAPADAASTATFSLLVTRLSTTAPSLDIDCEVYAGQPRAGGASGGGGQNTTWGAWVLPTEGAPPIGLRAGLNTSVALVMRIIGGTPLSGQRVRLAQGEAAWMVVVVLSNIDNGEQNPLPAATAFALALTAASLQATLDAHVAWWARFWAAGAIALPSRPDVERFYVAQQYLMGSAVRFGVGAGLGPFKTAPALSSAWLVGGEHNGFTIDYNAEAQFYGVASSNRAELVRPYARVVLDFVANARNESNFFQCPGGLHFPGAIGPFGYYNFNWMHMLSHGSFAALPLIWHWEYTRDAAFLADATIATADPTATPYALVRGLAAWWLCHLVKKPVPSAPNGYLWQDYDDCAYEDTNYYTRVDNHPQDQNVCNGTSYSGQLDRNDTSPIIRNPAISMGFLLKVMRSALDMSTALGVDADLRPLWLDVVNNMQPFPLATVPDPYSKENITVLAPQEHPLYWPGQLNPLAIYALWPSEELGLGADSAELLSIGERTVRTMGAMGSYSNGNAFPEIFPAAVRAGVNPLFVLGNMSAEITRTMAPNGMLDEGQECSGATQAVNDMLMSSYGTPQPAIRLFAGWPLAEDASFTTLRAKGAFVVSGAISGGVVMPAYLLSEQGAACAVLSPWPGGGLVVRDAAGNEVPTQREPRLGAFTFATEKGATYTISET